MPEVPTPPDIEPALADIERLVDRSSWSRSPDDLARCAEAVLEFLGPVGDRAELVDVEDLEVVRDDGVVTTQPLGPVVRVVRRENADRSVLLVGHYDTVFPPDSGFDGVTVDGEVVRGPGVVDAKGGLVLVERILRMVEAAGADIGWELLIVGDEEIGSPGSAPVLAEAAGRHDFGLGYEPSMPDGTLAGARPGSANFAHVVRGRAAHAGRELDQGRNAVLAAGRLAEAMDQLRDDPEILANPAVLVGGTATNIVPDLAVLRSNIRAMTDAAASRALEALDAAMRRLSVDGITVEQHGGFGRPPKEMTPRYGALLGQVRDTGASMGLLVGWRDTGGVCDGNVLAGAGLTNVDNMGPVGGDLHRHTEYLRPESLPERAALSAALLIGYDRGDWEMET